MKKEIQIEKDLKAQNQEEVSLENIEKYWNKFLEETESSSLREMLSKAQYSLQNKTIDVRVGNQLAQNQILQSKDLMDFIRRQMKVDDLSMTVTIDETLAAPPPDVKPITPAEILDEMQSKEPLLGTLIEKLDLKLKK